MRPFYIDTHTYSQIHEKQNTKINFSQLTAENNKLKAFLKC